MTTKAGNHQLKKSAVLVSALAAIGGAAICSSASAALITFDTLVAGVTTYGYDGDGDAINDVIFSTTDPSGFNTVGPGTNMTYIHEPGIEGTALLNPDLRVDFLRRATGSLTFGYALDSSVSDPAYFASVRVFDASGTQIASASQQGDFTITHPPSGLSSYPEGQISLAFAGEAAYATFDFTSQYGRYILDNFGGTFGSTERPPLPPVPEPETYAMLLAGLGVLGLAARRRKQQAS